MTISFLPAKHGDCIHICHNNKNVIIDTGTPNSNAFHYIINEIKKLNQKIDLLVITHYDYDHIGGVVKMDSRNWECINNVWFNSAHRTIPSVNKDGYLSIKQANKVQKELEAYNVKWEKDLTRGKTFNLGDDWTLEILYGGNDIIPNETGDCLTTPKCDWDSSLEQLQPYLNDKILDNSDVNASSIIILLTNKKHNILFPGDSTPEFLLNALSEYSEEEPLKLDLFKLPHHGSYKNITQEILKRIICSDYVILTNGDVHFHPNKKMILKVLNWGRRVDENIRFHLNYYQDLCKCLKITDSEKIKYKFELDGNIEFKI